MPTQDPSLLIWILGFAVFGSVLSLAAGAGYLLLPARLREHTVAHLISFATGTLLGVTFMDLLPEALEYQRGDGLWCGFLPEPDVAPDTSGSAGIAAAVFIAARLGAAEPAWILAARRALQGCLDRLSLHGFLTGVSQSNKREGGPAFQRSPHRVSLQFGMGLLGVLLAASRRFPAGAA